jgi:hypothetical protein
MLGYYTGKGLAQAIFEPNLFPYNTTTFLKPSSFFTPTCQEDGTECSETSAYKIQTPRNYPEAYNIQNTAKFEIRIGRSLQNLS